MTLTHEYIERATERGICNPKGYRYTARTNGGDWSVDEPLTVEKLNKHIRELQKMLEIAHNVRAEIQRYGVMDPMLPKES